jgi:hypothetical protein
VKTTGDRHLAVVFTEWYTGEMKMTKGVLGRMNRAGERIKRPHRVKRTGFFAATSDGKLFPIVFPPIPHVESRPHFPIDSAPLCNCRDGDPSKARVIVLTTEEHEVKIRRLRAQLDLLERTKAGEFGEVFGQTHSRTQAAHVHGHTHHTKCAVVIWAYKVLQLGRPEFSYQSHENEVQRAVDLVTKNWLYIVSNHRSHSLWTIADSLRCGSIAVTIAPRHRTFTGSMEASALEYHREACLNLRGMILRGPTREIVSEYRCPTCSWMFDNDGWRARLERWYKDECVGLPYPEGRRPPHLFREHPINQATVSKSVLFNCRNCNETCAPYVAILSHTLNRIGFPDALHPTKRGDDRTVQQFAKKVRRVG